MSLLVCLTFFFFLFPISTGFLLIICFILLSSFFFLYLLRLVVWKEAWWCVRVLGVNAVRCVCVCVQIHDSTCLPLVFFSVLFIFHLLIYNKLIKKKKKRTMPNTSPKQDTSAYPLFVCCVTEHRKKGVTHLPMRGTVESARPHSNEPANVCVCALLFICLLASSVAFLVAVFRRTFNFLFFFF